MVMAAEQMVYFFYAVESFEGQDEHFELHL